MPSAHLDRLPCVPCRSCAATHYNLSPSAGHWNLRALHLDGARARALPDTGGHDASLQPICVCLVLGPSSGICTHAHRRNSDTTRDTAMPTAKAYVHTCTQPRALVQRHSHGHAEMRTCRCGRFRGSPLHVMPSARDPRYRCRVLLRRSAPASRRPPQSREGLRHALHCAAAPALVHYASIRGPGWRRRRPACGCRRP